MNKNQAYIVYFMPRMESNFTRSITQFPNDCKADIYAYNVANQDDIYNYAQYQSYTAGALSPVSDALKLVEGYYDIYATSMKNASSPPLFTDSLATGLTNGIDYLWCSVDSVQITSSGTTVPLTFNHCGVQIVFEFEDGNSESDLEYIDAVNIQCPAVPLTLKWNLKTGVIDDATSLYSELAGMSVDEMRTSILIVPLKYSGSIEAEITVTYKGVTDKESITLEIPVPSDGYEGGKSYQYLIELSKEGSTVAPVMVNDWIDVDNDSNPIIVQ